MTSPVKRKATKRNVRSTQNLWQLLQEDLALVNGLLLDQVLRKSGILLKTARKEPGTILQKRCCLNLQSRGKLKSKGKGKVSIHFSADTGTVDTLSHHPFCQSAQYLRSSGSDM